MSLDVLLATYNGASYIREQLDSLLAQIGGEFQIMVRDDRSTDATPAIIGDYAERHPGKFYLLPPKERLGACGNFAFLLQESQAAYVATCDQDDVWMRDKLSRSLFVMQEMENHYGAGAPILVHGDAQLVDEQARELAPSFAAAQKLAPENALLNRLLMQNHVLGCTMLANRALLDLALPIPPEARMHDHWLALVAAAMGHTAYITEPLLYYRQHAGNAIGHRQHNIKGLAKLSPRKKIRATMQDNALQAQALMAKLKGKLPGLSEYQLHQFIRLSRLPAPARIGGMLAGGYLRTPWWQNIPLMLS